MTIIAGMRAPVAAHWPGILLAGTIAAAASFVSAHYGAPAMLFALLIGMAFNFLIVDNSRVVPGVEFCASKALRAGVALLGIRISVGDFMEFGWRGMISTAALVLTTIVSGLLIARFFQKSWRFGLVSGGAVAICGASAALAISAVVSKGKSDESDTLFTVVAVTSLSTIAMIIYPVLFDLLDLSDRQVGLLIGMTIHDVAHVVGAGFSVSQVAGDAATVAKLFRVALLPVVLVIIILALGPTRRQAGTPTVPLFLVVFVLLATINSTVSVPPLLANGIESSSRGLLIAAIGALGIKTSLKVITEVGGKKLLSILAATIFLLAGAVATMKFILTS